MAVEGDLNSDQRVACLHSSLPRTPLTAQPRHLGVGGAQLDLDVKRPSIRQGLLPGVAIDRIEKIRCQAAVGSTFNPLASLGPRKG
jgi:hypothetical protein